MKNDELNYSKIMNLASELKVVAGNIESLLSIIKDDYSNIGLNETTWSGDSAEKVKEVFELTNDKTTLFVSQINSYADALVNDFIRNED